MVFECVLLEYINLFHGFQPHFKKDIQFWRDVILREGGKSIALSIVKSYLAEGII